MEELHVEAGKAKPFGLRLAPPPPKPPRDCPVAVPWGALPRDPAKNRAAVFTPYNIVSACVLRPTAAPPRAYLWPGSGRRLAFAGTAASWRVLAVVGNRHRRRLALNSLPLLLPPLPQVFGGGERYLLSVVAVMQVRSC